jgi:hypothetical protein
MICIIDIDIYIYKKQKGRKRDESFEVADGYKEKNKKEKHPIRTDRQK